ncbi:unnamed protein product [Rodentolepis nana]|uniref:Uncharacterized protein n=1 Tax=Rodentolepis nana TaxID=102285 RepID=A0A0R3TTI8_RODNA|nr:unnamed protein product [Rodentolepis nana]
MWCTLDNVSSYGKKSLTRQSIRPRFIMIRLKQGYKRNRPRQGESQRLQILQWSAGGMSQDQKIQVQKILQTYDENILTIMEANLSDDKLKYYQFPGYTLYFYLNTGKLQVEF